MIEKREFDIGRMMAGMVRDPSIAAAYDAPFPTVEYKAGPFIMPQLVPASLDNPAREANLQAWKVFEKWDKPLLTAFGDKDPITGGGERIFQRKVPGAKGQPHTTVQGGGHFIQETHGKELVEIINQFIAATK